MAGYSRQSLFEIAEAERLLGYDEDAEVYRSGGRVFRRIRSGSAEYYRRILHALEQTESLSKEIVATQEVNSSPQKTSELLLEHENIPYITHPQEWSPSMLKDAANTGSLKF